jgi:hypothetical protein
VVKLAVPAQAVLGTCQGAKTEKQFVVIAVGGGNQYNSTFSGQPVAHSLS